MIIDNQLKSHTFKNKMQPEPHYSGHMEDEDNSRVIIFGTKHSTQFVMVNRNLDDDISIEDYSTTSSSSSPSVIENPKFPENDDKKNSQVDEVIGISSTSSSFVELQQITGGTQPRNPDMEDACVNWCLLFMVILAVGAVVLITYGKASGVF